MQRRGRSGKGPGATVASGDADFQPLGASGAKKQPRAASKGTKFFNRPCEVDGFKFDSQAEAARYMGLYVALKAGDIRDLEVHPRFPLVIHEQDCGVYEADFSYVAVKSGERIVEDVKSPVTRKLPTYRLKIKMVWALYGLRVREVVP